MVHKVTPMDDIDLHYDHVAALRGRYLGPCGCHLLTRAGDDGEHSDLPDPTAGGPAVTILRADMADAATFERVRQLLGPLLEAIGSGLNDLPKRLLKPYGWHYEVWEGYRKVSGAPISCVQVVIADSQGRELARGWSEPGWSLATLAVLLHDLGWGVGVRPAAAFALEVVSAAAMAGGYAGRVGPCP